MIDTPTFFSIIGSLTAAVAAVFGLAVWLGKTMLADRDEAIDAQAKLIEEYRAEQRATALATLAASQKTVEEQARMIAQHHEERRKWIEDRDRLLAAIGRGVPEGRP